jgi:telomere length regulation protein
VEQAASRFQLLLNDPTLTMDGLLTAVKTVKRDQSSPLVAAASEVQARENPTKPTIDLDQHDISSQQAIDVLGSHPDRDELFITLSAIDPFNTSRHIQDLDIRVPSPTTAQILRLLVSTTIPDHWASLDKKVKTSKETKTRAAILRCLSSVAGLGSLITQLRSQIASARANAQQAEGSSSSLAVRDLLSVLASLLEPKDLLFRLYSDISALHGNKTKEQVAWRELASLVGAGKILSTAAEALTVSGESELPSLISWTGEGSRYTSWLGNNIAHMASKLKVDDEIGWGSLAFLTGRGLSLGYAGTHDKSLQIIWHLLTSL